MLSLRLSKVILGLFNRVFYSDHLIQTLVHLMSTLSDVREFQRLNHGLIFANTLHHAFNRSSLWNLFWANSLSRMALTILALALTSHFHLSTHQGLHNDLVDHSKAAYKWLIDGLSSLPILQLDFHLAF